jgi:hypothetical protein
MSSAGSLESLKSDGTTDAFIDQDDFFSMERGCELFGNFPEAKEPVEQSLAHHIPSPIRLTTPSNADKQREPAVLRLYDPNQTRSLLLTG